MGKRFPFISLYGIMLLCCCSLLPQKAKIMIEYSPGLVTVAAGDTCTVLAAITPDEAARSLVAVYVSENESIATVDYTQTTILVHGIAPGTTRVVSRIEDQNSFSFLVTVTDKTGSSSTHQKYIMSTMSAISIDRGKDVTLKAELVNGSPIEQNELTWTSSNTGILAVTGCGGNVLVSAITAGSAEIVITHPDSINIFVIAVKVNDLSSGISLNTTGLSLNTGDDYVLQASIPQAGSAELNGITWTTDPREQNVVVILGSGKSVTVLANNSGNVTIIAHTLSGITASCQVIVNEPKTLTLSPSLLAFKPGDVKTIIINKTPANMLLSVNTTNPDVVSFVYNALTNTIEVTALKEGLAVIQASGAGLLAKTDCKVTQDRFFEIDTQVISCRPDQTATVHYSVLPVDEIITWTVADPNVATYTCNADTNTVTINPLTEGTTTLIGRTASGMARTVNLNFWYSSLEVSYASTFIGGTTQQAAIDNSYINPAEGKIYIGWRAQYKITLSFNQKGVRINSPVTWIKSSDFRTDIECQELDGGRQLILYFNTKLKPGVVKSYYGNAGSISYTVNYGNNKSYTVTFAVVYWLGSLGLL